MPRMVAPPPSGEFNIRLSKPFQGAPTRTIEIIGEPNRSSSISIVQSTSASNTNKKTGDCAADDTQELMSLVSQLRGFPTNPSTDIYGLDIKLEIYTFDVQWASDEEDSATAELGDESKETFKNVTDSIEALARQFAKQDAAI